MKFYNILHFRCHSNHNICGFFADCSNLGTQPCHDHVYGLSEKGSNSGLYWLQFTNWSLDHWITFMLFWVSYKKDCTKVVKFFVIVVGVCHAFHVVWCEIEIYPTCVPTAIDSLALTKLDEKTYTKNVRYITKSFLTKKIENLEKSFIYLYSMQQLEA